MRKLTTEDFIAKARSIHGDKYDYSKTEYVSSRIKLCIICPIHGEFWQTSREHLTTKGCPKCSLDNFKHPNRLTTEEFINRSNKVHNHKYDYSKSKFKSIRNKVIITCPIHGDFQVTPNHFLGNRGCPKCGGNYRLNTGEFIEKLKLIHGNKYCYDKVEYKTTHKSVILICPKHGEFINTPANLLKGQGCPYCLESKMEEEVAKYLQKQNVIFEKQKKFEWLKYKRELPLDFYLPKYNIAIECQGIQHFEPIEFFGGEESFELNQRRDDTKKILCEEHDITLLYYSSVKDKYLKKISIQDL